MIVNKAAFLLKEIPQFHPASEEYLLFWREENAIPENQFHHDLFQYFF